MLLDNFEAVWKSVLAVTVGKCQSFAYVQFSLYLNIQPRYSCIVENIWASNCHIISVFG